ncbi:hypothetical protein IH601_05205 [Candidatus Bipolaricaulota bacterium]|nr:hypothetical protein [Candidatus Bipolaricaulota bacterium]
MRRVGSSLALLLALVFVAQSAFGVETVITSGGSVISGTIESGLPAMVSITSETDDVFTFQRTNIKHLRFGKNREVTVETFDGNIIVGRLGGISDVFGLRTASGDIQSLNVDSIVEIRFEEDTVQEAEAAATPTITSDLSVSDFAGLVDQVIEVYGERSGSFTLGLDSGLQLGYSRLNGFDVPRYTIGINAFLVGAAWRIYFPPSTAVVEKKANQIIDKGVNGFDSLLEEVKKESYPFLLPYLQIGVDGLMFPHLGGGFLLRINSMLYIDLGATLDTIGVPWPSIGVLAFF